MAVCDFPGCDYSSPKRKLAGAKKRSMHTVPAKQKEEVTKCLGIAYSNKKAITICSAHFVKDAFVRTKRRRAKRLIPDQNFLKLLGKRSPRFSAGSSIKKAIRNSITRNHRISFTKGNLASGAVANSSSPSLSLQGSDNFDRACSSSAQATPCHRPIEISMRRAFQTADSRCSSSTSQHSEPMAAPPSPADGRRLADTYSLAYYESLRERLTPEYVRMAHDLEDMAQSLKRKIARLKEMIRAESGHAKKFLRKQRAKLQQLKEENHTLTSEQEALGEVCHDFFALQRMQDNYSSLLRRARAAPSTSSETYEDAM